MIGLGWWLFAVSVGAWGATWFNYSAGNFCSVEGVNIHGAACDTGFSVELDYWVP